jgi:hypothetical protein
MMGVGLLFGWFGWFGWPGEVGGAAAGLEGGKWVEGTGSANLGRRTGACSALEGVLTAWFLASSGQAQSQPQPPGMRQMMG